MLFPTAKAEPVEKTPDSTTSKGSLTPASDEELARALLAEMPTLQARETFEQRLYRKFTQEPLVPIGCGVTTYFLVSGIRSFMKRDAVRSQKMMRGRVLAQGFTVLAFCFYAGFENMGFPGRNNSEDKKEG